MGAFEPSTLNVPAEPDKPAFATVQSLGASVATEVTAFVQGGDGLIALQSLQNVARVHKFFTKEEIDELPRDLREKARKNGYFETEEVSRSDGTTPLRIDRGNAAYVTVRFLASAEQLENVTTGTLIIDFNGRTEIPLTFGGGAIHTVLSPDHLVIREKESANFRAQLTSTIGPDTDVLLKFFRTDANAFVLHAPPIRVPSGGTVNTTLSAFVDERARLGTSDVDVVVTAFDGRFVKHEPFNITVLPNVEAELMEASREIDRFHHDNMCQLIVGPPTGPHIRLADGTVRRSFTMGSISKPLNLPPFVDSRFAASIQIAAVKCFGTEDPSGTDEPYLVISIYGIDPEAGERQVQTVLIRPDGESVREKEVFLQGKQVAPEVFFPGEGSLRLAVSLWDEENGNPNEMREKQNDLVKLGVGFGLEKISPAAATAAEVTGILDAATKTITAGIAEIFADDLIATRSFELTHDTAVQIAANPDGMVLKSNSIPGIPYNFPRFREDDSPEGRGWLFENGGGSYRVFFRVGLRQFDRRP